MRTRSLKPWWSAFRTKRYTVELVIGVEWDEMMVTSDLDLAFYTLDSRGNASNKGIMVKTKSFFVSL